MVLLLSWTIHLLPSPIKINCLFALVKRIDVVYVSYVKAVNLCCENDHSQTMFMSDIRKLKAERCVVFYQCLLSIGTCFNLASCHEFEACMTHAIESDPSVSS